MILFEEIRLLEVDDVVGEVVISSFKVMAFLSSMIEDPTLVASTQQTARRKDNLLSRLLFLI